MAKTPKIDNEILLKAGLELMHREGKPMERLPAIGRQMRYRLSNNDTVRVRTCNDHILIVVAERPEPGARLNIEGTDWLLVVMPIMPRTPGEVIAYLVPTVEAVSEARRTHSEWLASNPNTKGENTTWNLWFDENGVGKANGYAKKWARFRLSGAISTDDITGGDSESVNNPVVLKDEVAAAQTRIARIAGVSPEAVKISIDFGS